MSKPGRRPGSPGSRGRSSPPRSAPARSRSAASMRERPGAASARRGHCREVGCATRLAEITIPHQYVRICLVYDCLYPHTVGGAERWYRALAERVAARGYDVTYLTLRQWEAGEEPTIPGVRVVAVGPRFELYADGRRRIGPALRFAAGVLAPPARPGAALRRRPLAARPRSSRCWRRVSRDGAAATASLVDWIEVWTRRYWREYLGPVGGSVAWSIQRLAARFGERAFCYSHLHARRLRAEGFRGPIDVVGVYAGPLDRPEPAPAEPLVVFVGRHIPEKGVLAVPPALARGAALAAGAAWRDLRRRTAARRGRARRGGARARPRRLGPGLRARGAKWRSRCGDRSACCSRPRARATGSWWSRPPRTRRLSSPWRARQRGARARRGRRQRRRRALDGARRPRSGDPARARGRRRAAAPRRRSGSLGARGSSPSTCRSRRSSAPTRKADARRLQPPPPRPRRDRRRRAVRAPAAPGTARGGRRASGRRRRRPAGREGGLGRGRRPSSRFASIRAAGPPRTGGADAPARRRPPLERRPVAQRLQHGAGDGPGPAGHDDPRRHPPAVSGRRRDRRAASSSSSRWRRGARARILTVSEAVEERTSCASSACRWIAWTSRPTAPG